MMEGYTRSNSMTIALAEALSDALYANPTQRLGQLLANLARNPSGATDVLRVWNTHDEEWVRLLTEATQERA